MKRWIWVAVPSVALALAGTGLMTRPKPIEAQGRGRGTLAIDFSKLLRGRGFTGTTSQDTCKIENSDGTVTARTTDIQKGIKLDLTVAPSHCDETPSTGGLDGKFEAELSGIEKRSASGGDVPPRPAADQPEKDNRGWFKGKWQIRNATGVVVARGEMSVFLHVNTHYAPGIEWSDNSACFIPGQIEGLIEGTALVGDHKGCRIGAVIAGHSFGETKEGVNLLLNAEGLIACPCDDKPGDLTTGG